jgi:hypothetical protein
MPPNARRRWIIDLRSGEQQIPYLGRRPRGTSRALASGNILDVNGALTSRATDKFITESSSNQFHHVTVSQEIQRTSVELSKGTDAKFPPDAIVVDERGYERATTHRTDTGAVDGVKQPQLADRYWVREQNGRFVIADWDLSEQEVGAIPVVSPPPSPSPSPSQPPSESPTPSAAATRRVQPAGVTGADKTGSGSTRWLFLGILLGGLILVGAGGGRAISVPRRGCGAVLVLEAGAAVGEGRISE